MRRFRILAAAAATVALAGATVGTTAATAATKEGVGTATAGSTILSVDLGGGSLTLDVLSDESSASIDEAVGDPEAFTTVSPLAVGSNLVDELNVSLDDVESRSGGDNESVETALVELPAEIAAAATGTINPITIQSLVDSAGAHSTLESALADLSAAGGLLSLDTAAIELASKAADGSSVATRSVSLDDLRVVGLGELLEGLGIDLETVPTDDLIGALDALNLPVPGIGSATDVQSLVDDLNGAVDDLQTAIADFPLGALLGSTSDLLTELGIAVPNVLNLAELNDALDAVQVELSTALTGLADTVDSADLLRLEEVTVAVTAKAKDTVGNSVADVTAAIGNITVGGLTIPGVDLLSTADELESTIDEVTSTIDGVLAQIDPGLGIGDLVDVSLLDQGTEVGKDGDYTQALAAFTAATISINPPADLDDIIAGLDPLDGVGQAIEDAGGALPDLGVGMADLNSALGGVSALASGATVEVLGLANTADFVLGSGGVEQPRDGTLPETGGETTFLLLGGGLLAAAALAGRRHLQDAVAPQKAQRNS